MKLFDLLKSLNTGATINPDATAPSNPDAQATTRNDNRNRLLDELSSLLELLDAPEAPAVDVVPASNGDSPPLLNLDAIFEGVGSDDSDNTQIVESSQPTDVQSSIDAKPETHQQLVRSLLDELLPMLEKALGDRLDQLDNDTLQQWTKAAGKAAPSSST